MEWKFLEIASGEVDVLLNSSEFTESTLLGETRRVERGASFLDGVASLAGTEVLVFDLLMFVTSLFSFPSEAPRKDRTKAVLVDVAGFSEDSRRAFGNYVEKVDKSVSPSLLLVQVGGSLQLVRIPLSQLKLLPAGIRAICRARGVVAMRFGDDGRPQYLLDLESIVLGSLDVW